MYLFFAPNLRRWKLFARFKNEETQKINSRRAHPKWNGPCFSCFQHLPSRPPRVRFIQIQKRTSFDASAVDEPVIASKSVSVAVKTRQPKRQKNRFQKARICLFFILVLDGSGKPLPFSSTVLKRAIPRLLGLACQPVCLLAAIGVSSSIG
jgi:hypothetical protein